MPVSIYTQEEFLLESKLNGFFLGGGFVVTLGLSGAVTSVVCSRWFVLVLLHLHLEFFIGEVK